MAKKTTINHNTLCTGLLLEIIMMALPIAITDNKIKTSVVKFIID